MSLRISVLASGSSGNAVCIAAGRSAVLVDSGLIARETERRLHEIGVNPGDVSGILISHAHIDHYRSAGTLHRRFDVPVYAHPATDRAVRRLLNPGSYHRIERTRPVPPRIDDFQIDSFPTRHGGWWHPAGRPAGFVIAARGVRVGIATDLGAPDDGVLRALRDCDVLVLEANHDRGTVLRKLADPGCGFDAGYLEWVLSDDGHLSNDDCAETLVRLAGPRLRHVFLAHLSENHHDPRRDNNCFEWARDCVLERLDRARVPVPRLHRTWRRGLTEGRPSAVVSVP